MRVFLRWFSLLLFPLLLLVLLLRRRNPPAEFRTDFLFNEIGLNQTYAAPSAPFVQISGAKNVEGDVNRKKSILFDVQPLDCVVNGHELQGCYLINGTRAAVDFDHLRNWHEVSGYLDVKNGKMVWDQSNVKFVPLSDDKYDHLGTYLNSADGETERRTHVKLVTTDSNVPISTQWNQSGYHYPIQISQFGLNYFSQYKKIAEFLLKNPNFNFPAHSKDILNFFSDIDPVLKSPAFWKCGLVEKKSTKVCRFGTKNTVRSTVADTGSFISFLVNNLPMQIDFPQLNTLYVVGANLSHNFRLIVHLRTADLVTSIELHYACSSSFGEGRIIIVC